MPKHPITIEDLAKIKVVGDPQMSADGTRVLYTVKLTNVEKNKYFSHLWLSDAGDGEARQFTFGEVSDSSPRWSPDDLEIAFLRNKDKRTQIWIAPSDGGEARQLTDLPEGSISDLKWSPDGKWLAFAFRPTHEDWTKDANKKREESGKSKPPRVITRVTYRLDGAGFQDERQHIWVCDVKSGETKQITRGDYDDACPAWSPDGRLIAFTSNREPDAERHRYRNDIWLVAARGGKAKKIKSYDGSKGALVWSPDGKFIACVGSESGEVGWQPKNSRLWVVSRSDGEARCLSLQLDRSVGEATLGDTRDAASTIPIWSADGRRIYMTVSDAGNTHVYAGDVASSEMTPLVQGARDVEGVTADAERRCFALLISDSTHPADVYVGELRGNSKRAQMPLKKITDVNREWMQSVQLSKPHEFWITQPDGTRVQGWLIRPPKFNVKKKYPMLLYVHGGPHAQYGNTFFHELQWHAARGYVVVYSNPRGSNGRDEAFGACIHRDWGNKDYDDVMAMADYAEQLPYVDNKCMAIAGGSYGGFMTNWVVGHTNRFKCGVTDRSICNWASMIGTTDVAMPPEGLWPGSPAGEEFELGWKLSPLRYVQNVRTPLLIIHSEGDLRCPITQAEEWFSALKWLKREAVFVRYPPETSHGMSRQGPIDLRFDRLTRIGDWLDKHLK